MTQTILDLTKQLIAIPSWVDDSCNESPIGEFIYQFLVKNSQLQVTKQFCSPNRFNVIAQNNVTVDLLVVGHMDTVQPSQSWTKNPTDPQIVNGKLYGLGSSDMKSGLALMLQLAVNTSLRANTMFLFYIDEEYDFFGMKKFIEEYAKKIKPKLIISLDGSDLALNLGCRGLIEISCTIKGLSGHAARPSSGINAISKSYQLINNLFLWLDNFDSPELGPTVYNLAYINGGQFQGKNNNNNLVLGKQGNIIADICQFIIDIRPAGIELDAKKVINFVKKETKKLKVSLINYSIRHNQANWITKIEEVGLMGLPNKYQDPSQVGYIDIQMLWQAFNRIPCFSIGAGTTSVAHKSDEYVKISKLLKLEAILNRILLKIKC